MKNSYSRFFVSLIILTGVLLIIFIMSLMIGPETFGLPRAQDLNGKMKSEIIWLIFWEIRLPRALLGLTVGVTLGLAGAALQGYLQNPLAEPGIIGVTASASLFSVIAFYSGLASFVTLALPVAGIMGALIAVIIIQLLAGRDTSPLTLILAGVAVTSFAGAMTSLALNLSPNPFAAYEVLFWLLGSLSNVSIDHVWISIPFMTLGWLILGTLGNPLNALTLGQDEATSLGTNLRSLRIYLIFGVATSVGAATAVAGAIGFVGLVIPHLLRPLAGYSPKKLLPLSAVGGGIMLLAADILARLLPFDREIKLGVLTAMVGAPFFLILLLKTRRSLL